MKIWFLLNEGQVTGPMTVAEIESHLPQVKNPLVWGRHQADWATPEKWRKNLQQNPTTTAEEAGPSSWKVRIEGKEFPSMSYETLLKQLKTMKDYSAVDIKNDSFDGWREIYAVPQLIDALGISRRSHPRVPIMGTLDGEIREQTFQARVISISEGGLGIHNGPELRLGEKFRGNLQSQNLFIPISATCEVVYVGNDGYIGLKFVGLPQEAQSTIIEYVNKFST